MKYAILVCLASFFGFAQMATASQTLQCTSLNAQDNPSFVELSVSNGEFKVLRAADGQNQSRLVKLNVKNMECAPYIHDPDFPRDTRAILAACDGEKSPIRILVLQFSPDTYQVQVIGRETVIDLICAQ